MNLRKILRIEILGFFGLGLKLTPMGQRPGMVSAKVDNPLSLWERAGVREALQGGINMILQLGT